MNTTIKRYMIADNHKSQMTADNHKSHFSTRWLCCGAAAALTALTALTACSASDDEAATGAAEIRLSSTVESQLTRSFGATNIPNLSTVWVWADQINATNNDRMDYFNAWKLTANGSGTLSSSKAKLYPATNALNFYGMKGNFTTSITEGTTLLPVYDTEKQLDGIVHEIKDDQQSDPDYYASDLLYAQLKNRTATNGDAVLNFYHMLSRVQIVLVLGNGGNSNNLLTKDDLKDAVVTILGVKNKVKFTPDTTKNISLTGETSDDKEPGRLLREAMLTLPTTDNNATTITVKTEVSTESDLTDNSYADAIVAPKQSFAAGTEFIKVEYMDRTTYYRLAEDLTLESGKRYRFKLYIDRIGSTYTVHPTIAAWTDVDGGEKWVE